jgi:hypothetical protein
MAAGDPISALCTELRHKIYDYTMNPFVKMVDVFPIERLMQAPAMPLTAVNQTLRHDFQEYWLKRGTYCIRWPTIEQAGVITGAQKVTAIRYWVANVLGRDKVRLLRHTAVQAGQVKLGLDLREQFEDDLVELWIEKGVVKSDICSSISRGSCRRIRTQIDIANRAEGHGEMDGEGLLRVMLHVAQLNGLCKLSSHFSLSSCRY